MFSFLNLAARFGPTPFMYCTLLSKLMIKTSFKKNNFSNSYKKTLPKW